MLGYLAERQGQPIIQRHVSNPSKKFLISYRSEQALTIGLMGLLAEESLIAQRLGRLGRKKPLAASSGAVAE